MSLRDVKTCTLWLIIMSETLVYIILMFVNLLHLYASELPSR